MDTVFFPNHDENINARKLIAECFLETADSIYIPSGQVVNLERKNAIYLISDGLVKQYFINEEGKQKIFMFLEKGQILGEINLFQGAIEQFLTQAITDVTLITIDEENLKNCVLNKPLLFQALLTLETEKLRYLMAQIFEENYLCTKERLFSFLRRIALYQSTSTPYGQKILLKLTHEELSSHIGTTRSTITRSLKELCAEGKITIYKHYIYMPS